MNKFLKLMIGLLIISMTQMQVVLASPQHLGAPIIIFISFSMPDASVKAILEDAAKINAPVLLRGLIDHSFQKTLQKIYAITQEKKHSLQIDPETFKKYHIEKVPAIVIRDESSGDYQVVYGDVVLEDALSIIARNSNAIGQVASKELLKLRQMRHA